MGGVRDERGGRYFCITAVGGGRLVLHASSDAAARPWLRLLAMAGVDVERTENGGYLFSFAGRPDLDPDQEEPAS